MSVLVMSIDSCVNDRSLISCLPSTGLHLGPSDDAYVWQREMKPIASTIFIRLMHHSNYILSFALIVLLSACQGGASRQNTDAATPPASESPQALAISEGLSVDHFNIWVTDPEKAKKRLMDIGFTAVPDSLSEVHHGQGTTGRYFNFLNGYLELIFVNDSAELQENNKANPELDFTARADFGKNGASPFSIALKMKDYDPERIPFQKVRYHQSWMKEGVAIYAAKRSKTHLNEPSVFVVYPEIVADHFETLADLQKIPEEYAFWRECFKHPNGAQRVTRINITSTDVDRAAETIQTLNGIDILTVQRGPAHLMELYFDDQVQGQSFDLRPEIPIVIYL